LRQHISRYNFILTPSAMIRLGRPLRIMPPRSQRLEQ